MEVLKENLINLTRLPTPEILPILGYFQLTKYPAHHRLFQIGEVSKCIWFVGSGLLRSYYTVEEPKRTASGNELLCREQTNWIVPQGGFLTDVRSFIYRIPAVYFVETLEPSTLYTLSYTHYEKLHREHPSLTRM